MKPFVGCPGSEVNWKEGSIYQDTEDDKRYSSYVISTNMSGMKY
jgi:outer membrane receptor for monomeric catechols